MTFLEVVLRDIEFHKREIEKLQAFLDSEVPWLVQEAIPKDKNESQQ
jgi:hypothetical protein